MNETNLSGLNDTLAGITPDAQQGQDIVGEIYGVLAGAVHAAAKFLVTAVFDFAGLQGGISDEQIDLLLSVSALLLFIFKWRAVYGMLKTYAYALLALLAIFVIAATWNII